MLSPYSPEGHLERWTRRVKQSLQSADPSFVHPRHLSAHPDDEVGLFQSCAEHLARDMAHFAIGSLQSAAGKCGLNAKSAFARLPSAVLGQILGDPLLRAEDVIAVSQSCGRLRSLILDTPEYWNKLTVLVPEVRPAAWHRFVIQRSKPAPLEMSLYVAGFPEPCEWTEDCCQILTATLDRLSRLEVFMEMDCSAPDDNRLWRLLKGTPFVMDMSLWTSICHALEHAAPRLRSCALIRHDDLRYERIVLPLGLFNAEAPLLRTCTIDGFVLETLVYYPAFSNLVTLHYHQPGSASSDLHLDDIERILEGLPFLETLCLSGHKICPDRDATLDDRVPLMGGAASNRNSVLRTVRMLSVREVSLSLLHLYNFFRKYGVQRFESEYFEGRYGYISADGVMQAFPHVQSMAARLDAYVEIRSRDSESSTLHIRCREWEVCFLVSEPRVYAHLEHLTVDESIWAHHQPLPAAPCLRSLCIVLGSCADYWLSSETWFFDSATCSIFQTERPWACPALRSVHLAYRPPGRDRKCRTAADSRSEELVQEWSPREPVRAACCCTDTLTISLRETYRFVATCLRFDSEAESASGILDLFRMSGVDPVDSDPEVLDLFSAIAENVQISATVDTTAVEQVQWRRCRQQGY